MAFIRGVVWLFISVASLQWIAATPTWHTASDGNSYLIEDDQTYNWLQAQDECARRNLQLVIIDSAEKNAPFDALLRQIFAHSPNLWLGHHDEFSEWQSTSRAFYASSTGNHLSFSNWAPNQPDNKNYAEHCTHIWYEHDYQWNDEVCQGDHSGYVCEHHQLTKKCNKDLEEQQHQLATNFNKQLEEQQHQLTANFNKQLEEQQHQLTTKFNQDLEEQKYQLTTKFNKELEEKRFNTNQKNDQLSADYKITRDDTQNALRNGHTNTNGISTDLANAVDLITKKSLESVRDIVRQKPYMEAVIADVGDIIGKILKDTQQEILEASKDAKSATQDVQMETENSVYMILDQFSNALENNSNEIDKILE